VESKNPAAEYCQFFRQSLGFCLSRIILNAASHLSDRLGAQLARPYSTQKMVSEKLAGVLFFD